MNMLHMYCERGWSPTICVGTSRDIAWPFFRPIQSHWFEPFCSCWFFANSLFIIRVMFKKCNSPEEWVAGMVGQHLSVREFQRVLNLKSKPNSFLCIISKSFLVSDFSSKGGLSAALLALVVVCNAITAKPRKEEAGERCAWIFVRSATIESFWS